MKNLSIQVYRDEDNRDKKFSPKITYPAPELSNTQDGSIGFHLQVPRGGTHPNAVGSEAHKFLFARISFLLQLVSFTADRIRCTDGVCEQNTLTHCVFSRTFAHISSLFTCTAWIKVSHDVSA